MKIILSVIVVSGLMFIFGTDANAQRKKIGMNRAQQIASTRAPGLKLRAKELEHEKGKWIYSFEFDNKDGSIREVNVTAYTGAVVSVEHENAKKEAKEESKENKGKY